MKVQIINRWDLYSLNITHFDINLECDHLIYFAPNEPSIDFIPSDEFLQNISERNITLHIILNSFDENTLPKLPNLIYYEWDTFFIYWIYNKLIKYNKKLLNYQQYNDVSDSEALFTLLINKPHYHRCVLMDILGQDIIDKNNVGWGQFNKEYKFFNWNQQIKVIDDVFKLKLFLITSNSQNNIVFGTDIHTEHMFGTNIHTKHKTSIQLVSETCSNHLFWTEKTFLPILLGKPFIVVGSKNINCGLKKFGFQLFDNLFDYTFDNFDLYEDRVKFIKNELEKINKINHVDIHDMTKSVCKHNRDVMLNIVKNNKFIPNKLITQLNKLNCNISKDYSTIHRNNII